VGLVLSAVVTLLALVLLLPVMQAPVAKVQVQVQESEVEAWATDITVGSVPLRSGGAPRPVPNQKRVPCTKGLELEVSGACWLSVTQRPCPPQTLAYQGQCLLPVAVPRR
jgi:serine/threonine-protein kinase